MKCPARRGEMGEGITSLPYELGKDKLIVVRDRPTMVCAQCVKKEVIKACLALC